MATNPLPNDAGGVAYYQAICKTAKLRQRGEWWQIVYSYPKADGVGWRNETFSCRTKSFTEAQDKLTDFLARARAEIDAAALARDPTIEELFTDYLAAKNLPRGNSLQSQKRHLCAAIGHLRPRDINDQTIADYMATRKNSDPNSGDFGKSLKSGSHRRALGAMKTVIRWGVRSRLVDASHVPAFDMPADSAPKVIYMRHAQERAFWDAAQRHGGRLGLFVALGLETAARKNALYRLTWDRVDFALRTIDLQDPDVPLSRKRNAVVPISDRLLPVLQQAHIAAGRRPQGRLFDGQMQKSFNAFARAIGMPWVTPHIMRHTWASLAAIDGVPLYHIAKMLADNIATVEKTYAKLAPSDLMAVVNRKRA